MDLKFSEEEHLILQRLSRKPLMEGPELMVLVNGDFDKAKGALIHLLETGLISVKGNLRDEKELYYSTIVTTPSKVKKALR